MYAIGNCYSVIILLKTTHTHTHTHINVTLKNHNRSTALERLVIDYWGGGGGLKLVSLAPTRRPPLLQWFESFGPFGPHEGFLARR